MEKLMTIRKQIDKEVREELSKETDKEEIILDQEDYINKLIDQMTHELIQHYASMAVKLATNFLYSTQRWMLRNKKIPIAVEINSTMKGYGGEIHARVWIPPETIEKIREIMRRKLKEKYVGSRLRIKVLKQILMKELKTESREIDALLSDMYSNTREDNDQA
jgi:hypothetical protein